MIRSVSRLLWLLPLLFFACGSPQWAEGEADETYAMEEEAPAGQPDQKIADGVMGNGGTADVDFSFASEPIKTKVPALLIKTGNMEVKTDEPKAARLQVKALVDKLGGYLTSDELSEDDYGLSVSLTVRVPGEKFDALFEGVSGLEDSKVESSSVNIQDVSEEYVDVATRLKTKRQVLEKYEGFLRSAKNIKEVLDVEGEIRVLQEEIESAEGRLRFLQDRVRFGTLTIRLFKTYPYSYEPASDDSFGDRVQQSLEWGWKGVKAFLLAVLTLWPLWIVGGAVWWFIRRAIRRKKAKKNTGDSSQAS